MYVKTPVFGLQEFWPPSDQVYHLLVLPLFLIPVLHGACMAHGIDLLYHVGTVRLSTCGIRGLWRRIRTSEKLRGGNKKKKKTSEKKTGTYDMFGQNQWTIPGMVQRLSNSDSEPTSIIPKKKHGPERNEYLVCGTYCKMAGGRPQRIGIRSISRGLDVAPQKHPCRPYHFSPAIK